MSERHPWRKATYSMTIRTGPGTSTNILVDGLTDGVFGMDRRKCFDFGVKRAGYVVTHLLTGAAVRHLACNLADAKEAVAVLHGADWNFTDPAEAPSPERIEVIKAVNRMGFAVDSSEFEGAVLSKASAATEPQP